MKLIWRSTLVNIVLLKMSACVVYKYSGRLTVQTPPLRVARRCHLTILPGYRGVQIIPHGADVRERSVARP